VAAGADRANVTTEDVSKRFLVRKSSDTIATTKTRMRAKMIMNSITAKMF
jgi:hypothetical protein